MLNIVLREDAEKWISMRASLHRLESVSDSCKALADALKKSVKDVNTELPSGEALDLPSRFDTDLHVLEEINRRVEHLLESTSGKAGDYAGAKNSRFIDSTRAVFNMAARDIPAIHDNIIVMLNNELPDMAKPIFEGNDVEGLTADAADASASLPTDLTTIMEEFSRRRSEKLQEIYESPTFSKLMTTFDARMRLEDIRDEAVSAIRSEISRKLGEEDAVALSQQEGRLDSDIADAVTRVAEDVMASGRDALAAEVLPRLEEGAGDNDEFVKKTFSEASALLVTSPRSGVVNQVAEALVAHFAELGYDDIIGADDVKAIMGSVA